MGVITGTFLEREKHPINLKWCNMFACLYKAAAAANVTSSVQPPGFQADGICQTENSSQGKVTFVIKISV